MCILNPSLPFKNKCYSFVEEFGQPVLMPNRHTKPQILKLTCGDAGVCRWPRRAVAGGVQTSDIPEGEPAQAGSQSQGPPAQTGGSEETSDCCSGQREPEGMSTWSNGGNFGVFDSAPPFERLFPLWQADYLQEASLLMAKLCYVEGEYRDALGNPHSLWSVCSDDKKRYTDLSLEPSLHVQCDVCWWVY